MTFDLLKMYKANRRSCTKYGIFDFIRGLYTLSTYPRKWSTYFYTLNLLVKSHLIQTINYSSMQKNALQHKITANMSLHSYELEWSRHFAQDSSREICQNHYRSLRKERPWAGHLKVRQSRGWSLFQVFRT